MDKATSITDFAVKLFGDDVETEEQALFVLMCVAVKAYAEAVDTPPVMVLESIQENVVEL